MVVPTPTNATANQTHNPHTFTEDSLGTGSLSSGCEGGPTSARARRRSADLATSNGCTPLSRPRSQIRGRDRVPNSNQASSPPVIASLNPSSRQQPAPRPARPPGSNAAASGTTQSHPSAEARSRKEEKARKTTMQVATLNMNGYGNLVRDHPDNKWGRLYRLMSDNRLGAVLLQETHLTAERVDSLHKMFAKKIRIFFSANTEAPTQREGVAVVLNSRYINSAGASATEIIPGRALQVCLPCQGGDSRVILCIYAPTSQGVEERCQFYKNLREYYDTHPNTLKPQLMAGDFNNIEDGADRLPIGSGRDASTEALDELKLSLNLMMTDGWRATYPTTREFTFHRGSGQEAVFSRLDRIYTTLDVFNSARDWRICESGIKSDHALVIVQLTSANAPLVGAGRPVFPLTLIKDKVLGRRIKDRGLEAIQELNRLEALGTRSEDANPQLILHRFKVDVMRIARTREREVVPKLLAEIRDHERALKCVLKDRSAQEGATLLEAEALTKQIRQLKQRRYKQQQQNSRATHRLYGDRPTKYWSKLHRECAPRDLINSFEREGQPGIAGEKTYESDPYKMADMARRHHMNVQRDDPSIKGPVEREEDIVTALASLDVRVSDQQAHAMGNEITYEDCELSLRFSKSGTAPGLDGIPFEFWKTLHARYIEDRRSPSRSNLNIICLIKAAFEDMRRYGVSAKTALSQGWIAPIYKEKGERTKIVNYRPITILNTDYKLLSKVLALRLATVAPEIINRAQAGFVPGRKIQNHTQLARLMMSWAEANEENGAIVALDQEKAYDKIAHDYLWRVLEKFGIPATFIKLVQSLYANAKTSVMVNGVLSKAYRIYRGVRQGDPLSCLLFDLAIEPLSAMIRKSDLKGFNVPKCQEALKAVLFADDTTVYLSSDDDFSVLQDIMDTWCAAAKARFNIGKTEIIPIGSPAFRKEMAETYRLTGSWRNYPQKVHVAQEGEAVRILGAFLGNGINQTEIWSLVLTKIVAMRQPLMTTLARWSAGHATIQGKRHVVQMIIGGMTQFLNTVQRMPDEILKRLDKVIRGYIWDNRYNSPVGIKHTYLPVSQGGLALLDLSARREAIDVMWLKAYLSFGDERPVWAFLADDLFAASVPKCYSRVKPELRVNPFMQKWHPKLQDLPAELKGIARVAKKFGLRLEGLAFSRKILCAMPMWNHIYADKVRLSRLSVPSKIVTCLQSKHKALSVGQLVEIANIISDPSHSPGPSCQCNGCTDIRASVNCENPHLCCSRARALIGTLPGKWNPCQRQPEDYESRAMEDLQKEGLGKDVCAFDRRVTVQGNIGDAFRIFTEASPVCNEAIPMELQESGVQLCVATDGSCLDNGYENARAGAGVFVSENHPLNTSLRLPADIDQSNQTGEIAATLIASSVFDPSTRLLQITDSQSTMDSITKWRKRHEDSGYITQRNSSLTRAVLSRLRMRKAHSLFKWVKGHKGHPGNEAADRLAAAGAAKSSEDQLSLATSPAFTVSGAKLQSITQKLAYKAIRAIKDSKTPSRPSTVANIDRIVSGAKEAFGVQLGEAAIWSSFRSKHVSRPASQFMWMAVHDGYMTGSHWLRPNMSAELQSRAYCAVCGEIDSITHIILECNAIGQELIWSLLKELWLLTGEVWHPPSWGTAFGAACAVLKTREGARKPTVEALWAILCVESVHLIWKLRCERVIQNEGRAFTTQEVTNRFYANLDSRLDLDRRTAMMARGKKALKPQDVESIWLPVLSSNGNLPPGWVGNSGVLVGIRRGR